jgi:hypothetical protein
VAGLSLAGTLDEAGDIVPFQTDRWERVKAGTLTRQYGRPYSIAWISRRRHPPRPACRPEADRAQKALADPYPLHKGMPVRRGERGFRIRSCGISPHVHPRGGIVGAAHSGTRPAITGVFRRYAASAGATPIWPTRPGHVASFLDAHVRERNRESGAPEMVHGAYRASGTNARAAASTAFSLPASMPI